MSVELIGDQLTGLEFEGQSLPVVYNNIRVGEFPGIESDIYTFPNDLRKDLARIRISEGAMTPRQRILEGERTIERFVLGIGRIVVTRANGNQEFFEFGGYPTDPTSVELHIDDIMQLQASEDFPFVVDEVCCDPPYKPGRFEDLP